MNTDDLRQRVLDILGGIAPEADLAALDGNAPLRESLDLDSMDFLNFISALHAATGIDIPETDYRQLSTLDRLLAYLHARPGQTG